MSSGKLYIIPIEPKENFKILDSLSFQFHFPYCWGTLPLEKVSQSIETKQIMNAVASGYKKIEVSKRL